MSPTPTPRAPGDSEAEKARQKAEQDLVKTRAETPRFRDLAEQLRHFDGLAAAIEKTFEGRRL